MNRREETYSALIGIVLAVCIGLIMLSCGGCAGKGFKIEIETKGPAAGQSKKVKMVTDYQIENGLSVKRNAETGEYEIELGSATTKDANTGVFMLLSQMLEMMRSFMIPGGVPLTPVPPAPDSVP